jgi:TPR repeat protein
MTLMVNKKPLRVRDRQEHSRLLRLARAGRPDAQTALAARLAQGPSADADLEGALYWYCKAAAQGYTLAKWSAGTMFLKGEGVTERRIDIGLLLIEQAARSGDTTACQFLSDCYTLGRFGKTIDLEVGEFWARLSNDHSRFREYGDAFLVDRYAIVLKEPRESAQVDR